MAKKWDKPVEGDDDGGITCVGDSAAFGVKYRGDEHHPKSLHPKCWLCNRPLGCIICSGIRRELLCVDHGRGNPKNWHDGIGPIWATPEALCEHGPIRKFQTIDNYPVEYRREYARIATQSRYDGHLQDNIGAYVDQVVRKA